MSSDTTNRMMTLQAIRQKLKQLNMQQQKHQEQEEKQHETDVSLSGSFNTSKEHSQTDVPSNTVDSLHMPDNGNIVSEPLPHHLLGSSLQRHNTVGITNMGATKMRNPLESLPLFPSQSSNTSLHKVQPDHELQKSQMPWLTGRSSCQNTEEFKVPRPASNYTDSQMEIGPCAQHVSCEMDTSELPTFTHPSSTSKRTMRHYNSTPEVHSSASKGTLSHLQSSSSKLKAWKPMRVRIQQHPVHKLKEEDDDDDTDLMNSVKPFNSSSHSKGRHTSLASSGYHSDMTIPTEDSLLGHAGASANKHLSVVACSGTAEHEPIVQCAESKKPPVESHHQSNVFAAQPPHRMVSVMSTPSLQGSQMKSSVFHTPSGEAMDSVTVNGEQYAVLKKVGRGGSAQVYMVLDANKNIRALKVVDLEGAGKEVVDSFRNEIQLLQRLQYCDSVIKMFNFELTQACLYVVLEFGEIDLSGFFSARAKQEQGLDRMMIKFYWREMLRAVKALHNEGVIHSDLKPANFMLVAGNLKLIDFGIANTLQQDKTSVLKDSRVGTPSYMSPEAIMAACDDSADDSMEEDSNRSRPKYKVGVRSDVWSLGCILYNMVYGRTPFQHIKNNMGKLQAITNPAYPIKFPHLSDPHLLDVLQKCLTRDVKSRPLTTELLAHPFLLNTDKENDSNCPMPSSQVAKVPSVTDSTPTVTDSESNESRQLKELLKSHLVQGSPRTAKAVNRTALLNLLQELDSNKE